jgi:hypothetical protein
MPAGRAEEIRASGKIELVGVGLSMSHRAVDVVPRPPHPLTPVILRNLKRQSVSQ